MRTVLSGSGADTTAAVKAYLAAGHQFKFADIFLIGDYDDPQAVRLTNWQSALDYPIWGTFLPSVVSRNDISSKIGLSVDDLTIEWTPVNSVPTSSIATANPYQLAQIGFFDNKLFRCWTVLMPTAGDAKTYGAIAMFGGRIANTEIKRGKITFTVNSFLDVINEMVPTNVIEMTDTTAGYAGATPPPGFSVVPQFNVIAGSTPGTIIADEISPNAHQIFADRFLSGMFLIFNGGGSSTLSRQLARISDNQRFPVAGGPHDFNQIFLYDPLPWTATPGDDTFYISGPYQVNQGAIASATLTNAGGGYTVGDILSIVQSGANSGTVQVTGTFFGAITDYQLVNPGTGYAPAAGLSGSGGTGAGAVFTITTGPTKGFPYVPAPQQGL